MLRAVALLAACGVALPASLSDAIDLPKSGWLAARDYGLRAAVDEAAWDARVARLHGGRQRCDGAADAAACVRALVGERRAKCQFGGTTDCEGLDALSNFFWRCERGVAIELGGLDGVRASETLLLQNAALFRRVVIDASPILREARRARAPDVAGVDAAVCSNNRSAPSELHFLAAKRFPEISGVAEFLSEVSLRQYHPRVFEFWERARRDWARVDWRALDAALDADDADESLGGALARARRGRSVVGVACAPLAQILRALGGISRVDLLVLDVEGAELEVLRSIDFRATRFGVIVVETFSPMMGTRPADFHARVVALMAELAPEYLVWREPGSHRPATLEQAGRNTWFVHSRFRASSMDAPSACTFRDAARRRPV